MDIEARRHIGTVAALKKKRGRRRQGREQERGEKTGKGGECSGKH